MAAKIKKIKLINYKRFRNFTIIPNENINILIGDNESGKSSILEAIDLVASGSTHRVELLGLDNLLNVNAVQDFLKGNKIFEQLPKLIIELYLDGEFDFNVNGKNNTDGKECDGIRLVCEPNPDYQSEIADALSTQEGYFPYDYYSFRFSTFFDEGYSGYKKKIHSLFIDSSNMNTSYATNDFIKRLYTQYTDNNVVERAIHRSEYRKLKLKFGEESLKSLDERVPEDNQYAFGLRNDSALDFESSLMIYENNVGINNKGTGKQVFIKTDFAMEHSGSNVDVILLEEPENHLSHVNLRKLVQRIVAANKAQLFVTTHNSYISTRLELNNVFILHDDCYEHPITLHELDVETAKYFMKAPPAGITNFSLSRKVILVEGPAEYMLFDKFYKSIADSSMEEDGVQVMDIRGLSFKRYLNVARLIKNRVAVAPFVKVVVSKTA